MYKLCFLAALFCVAAAAAAQRSRWAVEVGAFADRVPLSYFQKLNHKVYETEDVNQIYRYYVDAADKANAEQIRNDAKSAGCQYARIIDFDYLREVCEKECSYTPPTKIQPLPEKNPNKTSIYDGPSAAAPNSPNKNPDNPADNGNRGTKKDGISGYDPSPNHNFGGINAASGTNYEALQADDSLQRVEWIFFDFDKSNLREKSQQELDKVVYLLKKYPSFTVELHAHTDGKGSITYNERLSARRAASAQQYLRRLGISSKRVKSSKYGKSKPIAANELPTGDTPVGRQFNRRVEIRIFDKNGQIVDVVDVIQIPADLQPRD